MSLDALAAASSERLQAETVGNSYEDNMAFKLMADRIENKYVDINFCGLLN